jgi:two-component system chemotaxis response regulator CheY
MESLACALVVEDDPALRRMVSAYLKAMNISAIEAPDGRTALRELAGKVPDVICLDLMLPELSGFDLCEHIRREPQLRDVPVLIMSARGFPEDRAAAEEVGASAYLVKPFTRAQFSGQIDALLRR